MATHTLPHGTLVINNGEAKWFPIRESDFPDLPREGSLRRTVRTNGELVYVNECGLNRSVHHHGDRDRR